MLSSKQREYLAACNRRWNFKIGATGSGKSWLDYAVVIPKRLLALKGEGAAVLLGSRAERVQWTKQRRRGWRSRPNFQAPAVARRKFGQRQEGACHGPHCLHALCRKRALSGNKQTCELT